MIDEFLLRAALAALGMALAAGLLGCFVVWRRLAYFGDATAHAALLGVALSLATPLPVFLGVFLVAVAIALVLDRLEGGGQDANAVLAVLAYSALSLGVVAVSLLPGRRVDLELYLFGDVLTVTWADTGLIWVGALAILAILALRWSRLLTATLTPDLAYAAGYDPARDQRLLTLVIAGAVAVSIKVVGALLVAALLVIPASAARGLARTPEAMAVLSMALAGVSALGGIWLAVILDTPVGPTIVCAAALLFAIAQVVRLR